MSQEPTLPYIAQTVGGQGRCWGWSVNVFVLVRLVSIRVRPASYLEASATLEVFGFLMFLLRNAAQCSSMMR